MNRQEKDEFERKKAEAENMLNQTYFSSGKKAPNKGLKVPPLAERPGNDKGQTISKSPQGQKSGEKGFEKPKEKINSIKNNRPEAGRLLDMFNFNKINMDNDRLLILAVCLLLASDSDDELLMLALLYIML